MYIYVFISLNIFFLLLNVQHFRESNHIFSALEIVLLFIYYYIHHLQRICLSFLYHCTTVSHIHHPVFCDINAWVGMHCLSQNTGNPCLITKVLGIQKLSHASTIFRGCSYLFVQLHICLTHPPSSEGADIFLYYCKTVSRIHHLQKVQLSLCTTA